MSTATHLEVSPASGDVNVRTFVVLGGASFFVRRLRVATCAAAAAASAAVLAWALATRASPGRLGASATLALLAAVAYLRQESHDTMIVMRDIGIQLNSEGPWRLLGPRRRERNCFIPQADIMDLVIHEGFHGFGQVIFYMCVLTRGSEGGADGADVGGADASAIKIVFPAFLPRKEILVQVWKQSREVLFGSRRRYWRHVPGQGLKECR
jgi:hypothetical protein